MTGDRERRDRALYEIALSIGREGDLETTARTALSAYLDQLDCGAGAVVERRTDPDGGSAYEPVAAIPADVVESDHYRAAVEWLSDRPAGSLQETLPEVLDAGDGTWVHCFGLPGFGALLLQSGRRLPEETVAALPDLGRKLADVCRAEQERSGFERPQIETLQAAIPEPVVAVGVDGDRAVVRSVNAAFEEVFGYDRETVRGRPLSSVIVPDSTAVETPPEAWTHADRPVEREVRRETANGIRAFTVRSAPVAADGGIDRLGVYVDVSDQRERARTLEQLYAAAEEFLDSERSSEVCEAAVDAATNVLDFSTSGVHCYDRGERALVPVAFAGTESVLGGSPPSYTDTETVVWDVYRSGDPVVIDDTRAFEGQLPNEDTPARSALVLPLGNHGVFITSSRKPRSFDESDRYFGRLLATMLRTALDRVHREQSLRKIHRATSRLVTAEDTDEVGRTLVDRAADALEFPIVGLWEYDRTDDRLEPVAATAAAREALGSLPSFAPGEGPVGTAFETGPHRVENLQSDCFDVETDGAHGSAVAVPVEEFGVVAAYSTLPADFSTTEFELLQTLATGAGSAIHLVEQRTELSVLDGILARILRHNIRNELNAIRGRAQLLSDRDGGGLPEEIVESCDELMSTAKHAQEMREVLDRREQRTVLDLASELSAAVADVRTLYPGADVTLDADVDCQIRAHPDLTYAFRHAVENGVRHNDRPTPTVEVRARDRQGGVTVEIDDDGPGIPPSEVRPLRAGEETDLTHGSGVGLWILDRAVRYSGGTVEFDADEEGTTVRIRFDESVVVE